MKLKNLKISRKLQILIAFMILPLILIGSVGLYGVYLSNQGLRTIYVDRLIPSNQMASINNLMLQNMLQVHLATKHDPRLPESVLHADHTVMKHVNTIDENNKKIDEIWQKYLATYITPEERIIADNFQKALGEFKVKGLSVAQDGIKKGDFLDVNSHSATVLPKVYNAARDVGEKLLDYQLEVAEAEENKAERNFIIEIILIIGSVFGSIAVSTIMSWLIIRSITGPLSAVVARIKDIAEGEGDLTRRIEIDSKDETGELAEWINVFIAKVHDIVRLIADNTEQVLRSATDLTGASQNLSAGTEQMSNQSATIATASTQMSQNFQVISSAVEEMSISVGEVARKASEASSVATEAKVTAGHTDAVIKELGKNADQIGTVIESIVNIASQTNLLALNASIEAAGAGDAGRGFAVVASEVKELARQAGTASEDIKNRIGAIQKSAVNSVDAIGQITNIISRVTDISGSIASAVEEQSITAKEISNNVSQSTIASNDVAANVGGISQAAKDGAVSAAQVSQLAKSLEDLSNSLKKIVNQFKI
jgi:methyl-accepting chemotaxis protein